MHEARDEALDTSSELARYENYLRQELPTSLRQDLVAKVDEVLENAEEKLKGQLPNIFRDLQIRLFQNYRQLRQSELKQQSPGIGNQDKSLETGLNNDNTPASVASDSHVPDDLANQLAAYYPPPYVWDSVWHDAFGGFDGAVFEFPATFTMQSDSGYGSTWTGYNAITNLPESEPDTTNSRN